MLFPIKHTHHSLAMALLMGLLLGLLALVFQPPLPASAADPVIAGAGDIACDPANSSYNGGNGTTNNCRMKATSDLLVNMNLSGVFILGDNQMEDGAYDKYLQSYNPTWGRVKAITRPAVGNHDYLTTDAAGYYKYFGAAAGDPAKGYYSYDMGAWHIIVLNSNCGKAGGCSTGSPQEVWLKGDLAKNPNKCILSYWHHPRFSSGEWSGHNYDETDAFWQDLYAAHADVTMHGHDHDYERFALQNPSGQADPMGIREFVAGTGGNNHTPWTTVQPNSQVRNNDTYGVLKLTLHATSYDWQFVPEAGKTFTDSGTTACHNTIGGAITPTSTTVSGGTATPTGTTVSGGGDAVTLNPVADSYVDSSLPSTNYGIATQLRVDGSPVVRSYLRFNVGGLTGPVTQAILRIYANSAQSAGYGVYRVSSNTWSETALTYSNAPALGTLIRSSGGVSASTWVSVDVTPYITGNGTWSMALGTSSSTALSLASREAANKPQLVLTVGPSSAPTLTPTPVVPTSTSTTAPTATPIPGFQPSPPIQAVFFYPWFPDAWTQGGISPYTNYHPSLGYYSSTDDTVIDKQLTMAKQAHLEAMISSWWGQGHHTDTAFAHILGRSERSGSPYQDLRWAIYYENESQGDPTVSTLVSDLQYLATNYFGHTGYLRVNGKPVVFVYADANDACGMADRWVQAKNQLGGNLYLVLKVFAGYGSCASQPDSWHQYSPAVGYDVQGTFSAVASPGFWKVGESARLARDPVRFESDVKQVASSGAFWQLVTTWNEWGEGTSVEPATEWGNTYIDILCRNLPGSTSCSGLTTPTPTTAAATATPTNTPKPTATTGGGITPTLTSIPTSTVVPTNTPTTPPTPVGTPGSLTVNPVADSYVDSSVPSNNYGTATQLRVDGSPIVRSYLRFNISGLTGPVTQAMLRIYANSAQSTGYSVYRLSDNTWSETGLTYSNAPALGSVIRSSGAVAAGTWVSVDVTPFITGNGTWSLALGTSNSTALSLASREATNKPQLLLTVGSGGAPTPTSTTAASSPTPIPASPTSTPSGGSATSTPTRTMTSTTTPVPNTATPTATRTATTVVVNTPTRTPTLASTPGTLTFVPAADSYVDSANASINYGTSTQVRIDGSPTVNTYLRFNVTGLTSAIAKATLRLYANSSTSTGGQARGVANTSWGETTITYSNAPAPSSTVTGTSGVFSAGAWATVDITPLITGNGTYSIALTTTSSTAVGLGSRESGSHAPQLVITTK